MSSLTLENGMLVYRSDYDPALVAALKAAIPATDRRWDMARKVWLVAPQHGPTLVQLTSRYLRENIGVPQGGSVARRETRILDVRYIGATKDRGDNLPTAFGLDATGQWSVVLPESVLREWFSADARPDEVATLYAVLGVPASAADADIRASYRRLARTWHPDVCREPDAKEQFQRIQHAYEILRVPATRAKYDAGLKLEASLKNQPSQAGTWDTITQGYVPQGYRSPLRCGLLMVEGHELLGRFVVEKILLWSDITDSRGRILVTSWPAGAQAPVEVWS